ncbi:uncharacterized protein LOC124169344 isoform X2 [Ischnura elegans]|nr:uncharacterized protein LOC124169344 isoform X2 [Ischnura elegans]
MFSRIQGFISRHRRKFFGVAVAGAVIWGGWNYMIWKMQRSEEEHVREVLKKAKRHMHHKSSAQAAEKQVMALVPVAANAVNDALDTSGIVSQLKGGSKDERKDDKDTPAVLSPEDRLAKWDELKRVSIARAVAYAYIPSILIVFIRLQLGILGGYVFKSCGGDNIAAFLDGSEEKSRGENQESLPLEIQETYLSLTQFFLDGQLGSIAEKQVISFQESKDDFLDLKESYWGNHSDSNRKGKSKLNLGQPLNSDDKVPVISYHSLNSSQKKQNDLVIPSEILNEVQSPKGNGESDDRKIKDFQSPCNTKKVEDSNGGTVKIKDSDDRLRENNHDKVSVTCIGNEETNGDPSPVILNDDPSLCTTTKISPITNGLPSCYGSMNSDTQLHEISVTSRYTEEADDSKGIINGEIAEEDSGRCSGTDDVPEDEVVPVSRSKSGIEVLCSLLENKVGTVVDMLSLKTPLSLAETETLFWGVLTAIRSNPAEDPAYNLPKYLLPPPQKMQEAAQDIESRLGNNAAALFNEMITETTDLLETKEVVELVQSCVSAGLGHIMDRLANHFPEESLCFDSKEKSASLKVQEEDQKKPAIPLAKLIPIISKIAFEEGAPWVKLLLEMGNLKDFGANVYEAFTH